MKDTTTATRSLRLLLSGATAALLMAAAGGAQAQERPRDRRHRPRFVSEEWRVMSDE